MPVVKELVQSLITYFPNRCTLLAVCPNSESVARAALHAAKEANAPVLFAATLNQVDRDGGYTGWTPKAFVDFVQEYARKIQLDTQVLPCLDHGGPWLKDKHVQERLSFQESMEEVKKSIKACIDAGYVLLHIDTTVDITLPRGKALPVDTVVERTIELMDFSEAYIAEKGYTPISYEVGTEEVHGGLTTEERFQQFLTYLDKRLEEVGLKHAWPCFVVGDVGTDLHTTTFNPEVARRLTAYVRSYGALIKGHYTDYVTNPEDYPLAGMGGANVGPEFTEEEYKALMDLVKLERKLGKDSGFVDALQEAVIQSGRWKKWLRGEEEGKRFNELPPDRKEWLVRTGARYVWTIPEVIEARKCLYEHVEEHCDPDAFVLWRIKTSILKYFHSFNLINFNEKLQQVLG